MNGVHDMGGMHGFGLVAGSDTTVFHEPWEGRVFAMCFATFITYFPVDETRAAIERISPAKYLNSTYYERWLLGLEMLLLEHGHVTVDELNAKVHAMKGTQPSKTKMDPEMLRDFLYPGVSCAASVPVKPRFAVGDQVAVKVMNPATYTRAPRYARGKRGVVAKDFGGFAFPDTMGTQQGEHPQHVYSVRFTAQELWGAQATAGDSVHIDLYDDHLEPA